MNSPFAQIFLALQTQITDILTPLCPEGATPYIDMDYGQLENKERPAVAFPCVLIDFTDWRFTDLSNLVQEASGNITMKLATNPYSGTSNIAPEDYKDDALNILELEYALYKGLEGKRPCTGIGVLGRIHYTSDNRRAGLKVRHITFSCSFQDYSAKRPMNLVATPPANITATL